MLLILLPAPSTHCAGQVYGGHQHGMQPYTMCPYTMQYTALVHSALIHNALMYNAVHTIHCIHNVPILLCAQSQCLCIHCTQCIWYTLQPNTMRSYTMHSNTMYSCATRSFTEHSCLPLCLASLVSAIVRFVCLFCVCYCYMYIVVCHHRSVFS